MTISTSITDFLRSVGMYDYSDIIHRYTIRDYSINVLLSIGDIAKSRAFSKIICTLNI